MRYQTQHFANHGAWRDAGSPIGGIFPLSHEDRQHESVPERYRAIETLYYVVLPTGQWWCPWLKAFNAEQRHHGEGWNITGAWGRWTVRPSIQVDGWHGYLTKGILHDVNDEVKP